LHCINKYIKTIENVSFTYHPLQNRFLDNIAPVAIIGSNSTARYFTDPRVLER